MKFKSGVNPFGARTELLLALVVADSVWQKHEQELVVTSLNDGKHSKTSLHYDGKGADLRTHYFSDDVKNTVAEELRNALGNNQDFDVIVETDHIHIEYQPKFRSHV